MALDNGHFGLSWVVTCQPLGTIHLWSKGTEGRVFVLGCSKGRCCCYCLWVGGQGRLGVAFGVVV